jgi:hypothetical protein
MAIERLAGFTAEYAESAEGSPMNLRLFYLVIAPGSYGRFSSSLRPQRSLR